jgi:hypothetical protein
MLCPTQHIVPVAFVRTKTVKGIEYHYLVEGVREKGKVRQQVVAYLGPHKSVKAAHAYWTRMTKKEQSATDIKHAKQMVKKLARFL